MSAQHTQLLSDDIQDDPQDDPGRHDTIATLPLSQAHYQPQNTNLDTEFQPETYITQPTQPLNTPLAGRKIDASSPAVQVAASSPIQAPTQLQSQPQSSRAPSATPASRSPAINGFASAMAPPGTHFRSPYQATAESTQHQRPSQSETLTQTQTDLSDAGVSDSSDDDTRMRDNDIKPSTFVRGGRPVGPSRVEESPQNSNFSRFMYNGADSRAPKRMADPLTDGYANSTRPKKIQRQIAPARAEIPEEEMTLDDVEDYNLRQKTQHMRIILPKYSVKECLYALMRTKGNQASAQSWLVDEDERRDREAKTAASKTETAQSIDLTSSDLDELSAPMQVTTKKQSGPARSIATKWSSTQPPQKSLEPTSSAAPSTKQQPQAPQRSINEKYSKQTTESAKPEATVPKRRKLVRGGKVSPPPAESSSPIRAPTKPQSRHAQVIESDDDDEVSDSGVGSEEEEVDRDVEEELLSFLNTCSPGDLSDLSNQSREVVDHMITHRPYASLDQASEATIQSKTTTKAGKVRTTTRKVGERLVEASTRMWTGYKAVDKLVNQCAKLGKPLSEEMKLAGFNAYGTNGELDMVDIRSQSSHDSGIGTPSSSAPISDEEAATSMKLNKPRLLQQPSIMSAELVMKDYQIAGLNWLATLFKHKLSGLLCDDMGLGKTCQVIAFLTHLRQTGVQGTHLITVPGSTLENWLREFQTFSPTLNVKPYYGGQNERLEIREHLIDEMSYTDVIITTYDMATKPDDARFLRKKVNPCVCVYDEGHALKNRTSARYNALDSLSGNAQFRLILTGTPIQNNLQELISLLSFILPSIFRQHEEDLWYIFQQKVKLSNSNQSTSFSSSRILRARSMMTPFILRRKKHQVLKQLPKKTNRVEWCELTVAQRVLYDESAAKVSSVFKEDSKTDASTKNNVLMELRKAAIHPLLFRRFYTDEVCRKMAAAYVKHHRDRDAELVFQDMQVMTDFELHRMCIDVERDAAVSKALARYALPTLTDSTSSKNTNTNSSPNKKAKTQRRNRPIDVDNPPSAAAPETQAPWMQAAKVQSLLPLLRHNHATGHRTLLFSQFTMVLDILELALTSCGMEFYRLDGSTTISTRQDLIDAFRADESCSVFMLSTKAGGLGLNLTSADRVVIFDGSFNPHEDLQAENRCHRVGQTREVEVVRLVTKGTVEEKMLGLGGWKLGLDERVAGGGDAGAGPGVGGEETTGVLNEEDGEKRGMAAVQDMVRMELEGRSKSETESETKDLGEQYRHGLKAAGLNVAAAPVAAK